MTLADTGQLLGDPTRAAILEVLMDGRARTSGELARAAHVAASTASEHLSRLTEGGLLVVTPVGRHRYYRLQPRAAELVESVQSFGEPPKTSVPQELRFIRTCYDHLAGTVAVALRDRLTHEGAPTAYGEEVLRSWGVDLTPAKRPLLRDCIDWSERLPHLGGLLGARLLVHLLDQHWVARRQTPRALRLTRTGREALGATFGSDAAWS